MQRTSDYLSLLVGLIILTCAIAQVFTWQWLGFNHSRFAGPS
jgi:hypothetical protein